MEFRSETGGVTVTLEGGIADVRLDRPDKLNALDLAMFGHIRDALDWLGGQDDLRCVVLSGEGRSFCVGIDLSVLQSGVGDLTERTHGPANALQQVAWGWRTLPVPVIAAIHGHCFGAGIQMALGADIRIARADSELSIMEMRHGLIPDLAAFPLSRGVVREDVLRELIYTAKKVPGPEAQAMGLVTRLADDPHAEAMALARDIASKSPPAIRAAKRLFARLPEDDAATLLQAESDEETKLIARVMQGMTKG
jgi:enoyl-CoA hydratase/carnithine racemase